MALEIELKFQLSNGFPGATEALQTLLEMEPAYQLDSYYHHLLDNVYFDTPQYDLRQQDMGLRWRYFPDYIEQTLKGPAQGALLARQEYTKRWPSKTGHPTLSDLPFWSPAEANTLSTQLAPLFRTTFTRYTWEISLPEGSVEIVYDKGNITHPSNNSTPPDLIHEIEIELVSGEIAAVFRVAHDLVQQGNMVLSIQSKAARGYQRTHPEQPTHTSLTQAPWQAWHSQQQALLANTPDASDGLIRLLQKNDLPLSQEEKQQIITGLSDQGATFCYSPGYNLILLRWLQTAHHQSTV